MGYRSEPLDPDRHDLSGWDSGEPELDGWLRDHAAGAEVRRVARTLVWVADGRTDPVVDYYSLTGHRLVRDVLPTSSGRGSPTEIPAVLWSAQSRRKVSFWADHNVRVHGAGTKRFDTPQAWSSSSS